MNPHERLAWAQTLNKFGATFRGLLPLAMELMGDLDPPEGCDHHLTATKGDTVDIEGGEAPKLEHVAPIEMPIEQSVSKLESMQSMPGTDAHE